MERLLEGLAAGIQPGALIIITIGVAIGMVVGAAPGLGPTVGMTVAVPFALTMTPESAVFLLVSILVGANFGNSIPAVLIKVPGTSSTILTVLEGSPFHERGEGGRALMICLVASIVGQLVGIITFILFVIPLSRIAVRFLFPEVFAMVLIGLLAAAGLVNRQVVKGTVAVAIGLLLSTIGPDPITGHSRFTFGVPMLATGLSVIPVVVGLLAFRQVFAQSEEDLSAPRIKGGKLKVGWLSRKDLKDISVPVAIGSLVGTIVGAMPAAGGNVASFLAYQTVKMTSKDKSKFGKGSVKGLAGSDAANNACIGGDLIPTFALGIPGAPTMVVILAILTAQGLQPGPRLLDTRPILLYATFGGLMVATLVMAVLGYFAIRPSIHLSKLSPSATLVLTATLVVVGTYSLRWSLFDVWVALAMGIFGYLLEKHGYSVIAVALGFILGGLMEASLRRGLVMTFGWVGFFTRPVTLGLLVAAVVTMVLTALIGGRIEKED